MKFLLGLPWQLAILLCLSSFASAQCSSPTGLTAEVDFTNGKVTLNWANPVTYTSIEVRRDGITIATLPGSADSYNEIPATGVGYTYGVAGFCATGGISRLETVYTISDIIDPAVDTNLVWDPTDAAPGNLTSKPLRTALMDNSKQFARCYDLTSDALNLFLSGPEAGAGKVIWVLLGTRPNNHVMNKVEGDLLMQALCSACSVYCEGADTWVVDPEVAFHLQDGVYNGIRKKPWVGPSPPVCVEDGDNSLKKLNGFSGAVGPDMSSYSNKYAHDQASSEYTDRMEAVFPYNPVMEVIGATAEIIWRSAGVPNYITGIYYETPAGIGDVMACSFEFGGMGLSQADLANVAQAYSDCLKGDEGANGFPKALACYGSPGQGPLNPPAVLMNWQVPHGVDFDLGFNIYRDGQLIDTIDAQDREYFLQLPPSFVGKTELCVEGVSTLHGPSLQACCTCGFGGPPEDYCQFAAPVNVGPILLSTTNTSSSGPPSCTQFTSDIWLSFTPPETGLYSIDLCNSIEDTALAVYFDSGSCPPLPNQQIACNDDECQLQSAVLVELDMGQSYLIRAGMVNNQQGIIDLEINQECPLIENLECRYDCVLNEVQVQWDAPMSLTGVELFADGALVAAVPGGAQTFAIPLLQPGIREISILAVCPNGTSSERACVVEVLPSIAAATDLVVGLEARPDAIFGATDSSSSIASALVDNGQTVVLLRPQEIASIECLMAASQNVQRVWITMGTFPQNTILLPEESELLASLLDNGMSVYLEGGDQWGFLHSEGRLDLYDGIDFNASVDGDGSFDEMQGAALSAPFTTDFSLLGSAAYAQESPVDGDFTDRLAQASPADDPRVQTAEVIWRNVDNSATQTEGDYVTGIVSQVAAPNNPRMISVSWEFGGYQGDQTLLMAAYLDLLGLTAPPRQFDRGDCNGDSTLDIADVVTTLTYLFGGGTINCEDACDSNDDSALDIGDAIAAISALFGSPTLPLPAPFGACGDDPTPDAFGCDFSPCP